MFYAVSVFCSALFISLTAAYFSVLGLAAMFPGSQASVIVMGAVLEVGKLMGAVWLHKNWRDMGRIIRYYLLLSIFILIGVTSMGIFGYLSKAHIEHQSVVGQEESAVEEIQQKIQRLSDGVSRHEKKLAAIQSIKSDGNENSNTIIQTLKDRIIQINTELSSAVKSEESIISNLDARITLLNDARLSIEKSGGFGKTSKLKDLAAQQEEERDSIKVSRVQALDRINSRAESTAISVSGLRQRIDSLMHGASSAIEHNSSKEDGLYQKIEESHESISLLNLEKIKYDKKIKLILAEVGPIKYIAAAIEDVGGESLSIEKMIRWVIIILIFVFDPLAIILLIAATISFEIHKKQELPPDVKAIRNKLLDEIEEYVANGGLIEHFIERAQK